MNRIIKRIMLNLILIASNLYIFITYGTDWQLIIPVYSIALASVWLGAMSS